MKETNFTKPAGKLIPGPLGSYTCFVPQKPPKNIPLDKETAVLLSESERRLGMLSGAGELLPNPHLLIQPYLTKEAVLSSKIEGTQATLSDVLKFRARDESKKRSVGDVKEVANYINALEYGLQRIRDSEIDLGLIKGLHRILMTGVRGEDKEPGEFRKMQNWIGNEGTDIGDATFIPPAPDLLFGPLREFVDYLGEKDVPLLTQTAMMHYFFEAIHPFRDGNGRIGRLLITLFLCKREALSKPLLYLSAFFEKNREAYYGWLLKVSQKSEYEGWLKFFLRGIKEQAADAVERARQLVLLREEYHYKLREGKAVQNASRVLDRLFENPFTTIPKVEEFLGVSYPTAKRAIADLEETGIIEEITGQERNKLYCATEVLRILEI